MDTAGGNFDTQYYKSFLRNILHLSFVGKTQEAIQLTISVLIAIIDCIDFQNQAVQNLDQARKLHAEFIKRILKKVVAPNQNAQANANSNNCNLRFKDLSNSFNNGIPTTNGPASSSRAPTSSHYPNVTIPTTQPPNYIPGPNSWNTSTSRPFYNAPPTIPPQPLPSNIHKVSKECNVPKNDTATIVDTLFNNGKVPPLSKVTTNRGTKRKKNNLEEDKVAEPCVPNRTISPTQPFISVEINDETDFCFMSKYPEDPISKTLGAPTALQAPACQVVDIIKESAVEVSKNEEFAKESTVENKSERESVSPVYEDVTMPIVAQVADSNLRIKEEVVRKPNVDVTDLVAQKESVSPVFAAPNAVQESELRLMDSESASDNLVINIKDELVKELNVEDKTEAAKEPGYEAAVNIKDPEPENLIIEDSVVGESTPEKEESRSVLCSRSVAEKVTESKMAARIEEFNSEKLVIFNIKGEIVRDSVVEENIAETGSASPITVATENPGNQKVVMIEDHEPEKLVIVTIKEEIVREYDVEKNKSDERSFSPIFDTEDSNEIPVDAVEPGFFEVPPFEDVDEIFGGSTNEEESPETFIDISQANTPETQDSLELMLEESPFVVRDNPKRMSESDSDEISDHQFIQLDNLLNEISDSLPGLFESLPDYESDCTEILAAFCPECGETVKFLTSGEEFEVSNQLQCLNMDCAISLTINKFDETEEDDPLLVDEYHTLLEDEDSYSNFIKLELKYTDPEKSSKHHSQTLLINLNDCCCPCKCKIHQIGCIFNAWIKCYECEDFKVRINNQTVIKNISENICAKDQDLVNKLNDIFKPMKIRVRLSLDNSLVLQRNPNKKCNKLNFFWRFRSNYSISYTQK